MFRENFCVNAKIQGMFCYKYHIPTLKGVNKFFVYVKMLVGIPKLIK